jgi:PPOX class probable FMN-dependent enzyme
MNITSLEALRDLYALPKERVVRKQLASLDRHCRRIIELSPFLVLATTGPLGAMDASPRGGSPGFVKVRDDRTLLIPDAPGNNRLDSFENIVSNGRVGLLLLIPGVDETLRINGTAVLSRAQPDIEACTDERRAPKVVVKVTVQEAYLHCANALMRSKLWSAESQVDRSVLPTIGEMVNDQTGIEVAPITQEEMVKRYAADL